MLWLIVIGPLVLYPMARWKANRDPHPDPQLGLKVALHYFRMIAFQLLLVGALIVLWALMRKTSENRGDLYRAGFGLLLPAGLVFGAHVMLLMRTNDHVLVTVRRLFFGYNLLVTGLFGVTALVLAFQALFAKGPSDNEGRFYYAALVVYVCAWAGCAFHYIMMIDRSAAAGPRQNMAPPPPMAAAAGPGLPSLGGGFPPVGQ
ncbi:MAG TPA: hypothetical protein VMZ53_00670 [Kofleriaceae bacterium]|nr:hypothetical protein [Kofleriaceae bacterium]